MKATDLMIGDWVEVTQEGEKHFAKVQMIDGYGDNATADECVCDAIYYGIDELKPIPLTPEILEKNGFKKFDFMNIKGQHQWSFWIDTLTSVSLWCRNLNDDPNEGWMFRIESPLASCCHKIESVHELQHALRLCGIEKEIIL